MRQVAAEVQAVLGQARLVLLDAAWEYSPSWACVLCGLPGDSRVDDAVVLAYIDGEQTEARLGHVACGPSQLLPGRPPPAGMPAGAIAALTHINQSVGLTLAVLIVELGLVEATAVATPDGPMVTDQTLRRLRDDAGFATLSRDPLCLEASPAAAHGWAIERSGWVLTRVTAPPELGYPESGYLDLCGYELDEDWHAAADRLGQVVLLILPPGRLYAPRRLRTPATTAATMLAIDTGLQTADHDDLHPLAPTEHRLCWAIDRGEVVAASLPIRPASDL